MKNDQRHLAIKTILPLLLLIFIDEMGNALFFPIITPLIMDPVHGIFHHHVSLAVRQFDYGLTLGVFPLMMLISAPLLGDLSDYYGRKKILVLTLIGTCIGYAMSAIGVSHGSFGLLLAGRVLDGLTAGSFPIAQAAIVDLSSKKEKTANLSLVVLAISLGFIIGPVLAGVLSDSHLVHWFNLSLPLYFSSALSLINAILICFTFSETFVAKVKSIKFEWSKPVTLLTSAFKHPQIRSLSYILFILIFAWCIYIQFVSLFLYREYNFSEGQIAGFMVVMACSFALGSTFIIKRLLEILSSINIALLAFVISSIGVLITVTSHQEIMAWIGLVPISLGISLSHGPIMSLFSDQVSDDKQGWIMGVSGSVISFAAFVSSMLGILLADITARAPLWVALLSYVLGIVLISYLGRKTKQ